MKQDITLGGLITQEGRQRDAIHMAICAVVAYEDLIPGDHVAAVATDMNGWRMKRVESGDPKAIGIVDPFLTERIEKSDGFWLLLYPRTVTDLRHDWSHPVLDAIPADDLDNPDGWNCKGCD